MRYLLLFMFFVGIFVLSKRSCGYVHLGSGVTGEGEMRTESRTVSEFYGVSSSVPGRVEVSQSSQYAVEVRTYNNLLPLLKTDVEGGILKIYFDENVNEIGDLVIKVSMPSVEVLKVAGSGDIQAMTPFKGESLTLAVSGSGNMDISQMEYAKLKCSIAGSGEVEAGGNVQSAQTDVAGSGNLNGKALSAKSLDANIAGSGSVYMNVIEVIDGSVAGSGSVYYGGQPVVKLSVSGSGSIEHM